MIASSKDVAFILIDGSSVMGVTTELKDPGLERDSKEIVFLGADMKQKMLTGVSSCDIEQTGVFDDATGVLHMALKTPSNDRVFCWGACGNTIGKHFVGALVDEVAYNPSGQSADFIMASAKYSCSKYDSGLIVANLAARTTAGDTKTTYADLAAGGPFILGGVAYLQLAALTLGGYTNLVVTIAHSPDHSAWATLGTFTAKTAKGAQRLLVATNPIERYLAITWAWTGSGTGQSATLAVGFAAN